MLQRTSPRRVFLLTLLASLLVQCAWILALPAYRGSDEFDHVYKAEAVAHGEFLDEGPAANGRGGLVLVRDSVQSSAAQMCSYYDYTRSDNCRAVEERGDGLVTVASAASRYNPVYYAVVGVAGLPFKGVAVNMAMRVCSAVIAALLLAWAALVTATWARTLWPLLAYLIGLTPVLLYSTAVAAPNGIGYAAACLLWASALALLNGDNRPHGMALSVAALTMLVTHTTGVVWVCGVALAVVALQPVREWLVLLRRWPRQLGSAAAVVILGALACCAYIVVAQPNARGREEFRFNSLEAMDLLSSQVVWTAQTIGAFPLRNEPAPVVVYGIWAVFVASLIWMGVRSAARRIRVALGLLLIIWVAVPMTLTVWSYRTEGLAWQGRYALPLAVGFLALAGLALDCAGKEPRPGWTLGVVLGCAAGHAVSVVSVAVKEIDRGLVGTFTAGHPERIVLIGVLAVVGSLVPLAMGAGRGRRGVRDAARGPSADRSVPARTGAAPAPTPSED